MGKMENVTNVEVLPLANVASYKLGIGNWTLATLDTGSISCGRGRLLLAKNKRNREGLHAGEVGSHLQERTL
jgi:hypothetical protein